MNPKRECRKPSFTVLMAEDDLDDRFLMEQAFKELQSKSELRFVQDGEELIDYLLHKGKYADPKHSPQPSLVLLDLNMPKKDGRQALAEIKTFPDLQKIPIAVWTTSDLEEDEMQCRDLGANTYITKPMGYAELVNTVKELVVKYCFGENCKV